MPTAVVASVRWTQGSRPVVELPPSRRALTHSSDSTQVLNCHFKFIIGIVCCANVVGMSDESNQRAQTSANAKILTECDPGFKSRFL